MRLSDIGDQPIVRSGYFHKLANVSRVARPHLNDRYFRVRGHPEYGKRHAYIIVQIAAGRVCAVFR